MSTIKLIKYLHLLKRHVAKFKQALPKSVLCAVVHQLEEDTRGRKEDKEDGEWLYQIISPIKLGHGIGFSILN